MVSILISWAIITCGILAAAHLIPGVRVRGLRDAIIGAAVLGLLNVLLRPIMVFLTFPVTILTLGLFLFVINALVFWLAGSMTEGFEVKSFWSALLGSVIVSIVSFIANWLIL